MQHPDKIFATYLCMGGSELREGEANGGRWAGRGGRKQTALNNCPKLLVCVRRAAAAAARAPGWDGPDPCTQLRSTIWLAASPAVMHDPRVATYVAPFGCHLAGTEALSSIWPLLPLSCEPLKRSYI